MKKTIGELEPLLSFLNEQMKKEGDRDGFAYPIMKTYRKIHQKLQETVSGISKKYIKSNTHQEFFSLMMQIEYMESLEDPTDDQKKEKESLIEKKNNMLKDDFSLTTEYQNYKSSQQSIRDVEVDVDIHKIKKSALPDKITPADILMFEEYELILKEEE